MSKWIIGFPGTLNNSFFTMLKYLLLATSFCKVLLLKLWMKTWWYVWLLKSNLNSGTHLLVGMCTYSAQISFECFVALKKKKTTCQESYLRRVEERHNNPRNLISQLISCHDMEKLPAWLTSIQLTYFGLSWHYYWQCKEAQNQSQKWHDDEAMILWLLCSLVGIK